MKNLRILLAVILLVISSTTYAQQKGEWNVRLRGVGVIPQEKATIGVIGGDVDISKSFIPELDFTYYFANNFSAELILGTTRHKVKTTSSNLAAIGGPASADVDLGKVWLLPPTLTLQYHVPTGGIMRPYIGAGVNYTIFYGADEGPTVKGVDYKNSFAFAAQAGVDIDLNKKWFLNIDVKRIFLNTDVTVDASNLTPASNPSLEPTLRNIPADVKIRPWLIGVGIGCRL
ncbi:outer membrane beta-barrel protein [Mucilaginibacter roseus]|uniref:Outer membrane beta-barrel protein n=1 Tax=Mucilaginibacter roseus TaxID=1528868 RepID=A0ABS8U4U1_9SPHI|nr:OmpW family outer membrane protein [Mucilaginibacter roseus]MCD8740894.1 outer membrane beta-barrel protein [Mucilaginibacter roseus]